MKTAPRLIAAAVLVMTVAAGGEGIAGARPGASSDPDPTVWLCRPGLRDNPCAADRTATVMGPSAGTARREQPRRARRRPIDCFYVYPTVSLQQATNAEREREPNVVNVAIAQASRFSEVCRVYAPVYRQLTLASLARGGITPEAGAIAYGSVRSAWREYLDRYNDGRGVVLIGHSQGAGMLDQLVRAEIDGRRSERRKLVSALLLGGNVLVPRGRDVGGDFAHVPACRSARQTGCVVAYSAFTGTPPADALFGYARNSFNAGNRDVSDDEVLCVNPAALRGGKAVVRPYYPTHLDLGFLGTALPASSLAPVPEPWVTFPGSTRAECRRANGATWLEINDRGTPADHRPRLVNSIGPTWGLHLVDVNVTLGDLVNLVERQGQAYER
jgi:hypothetical protein